MLAKLAFIGVKMSSKNNPEARGKVTELRVHNGKKVKPVLYVGRSVGHGNYIAAQMEDGALVMDRNNKPIPYKNI